MMSSKNIARFERYLTLFLQIIISIAVCTPARYLKVCIQQNFTRPGVLWPYWKNVEQNWKRYMSAYKFRFALYVSATFGNLT